MDSLSEKTDEEVAAGVKQGNIEAFGILVERYEEKLTRYGKRFLFDREDVKDLVQNVFLKAYANIQSFDSGRRFSPWIYRIAHNEFINAIKRRAGKDTVSLFDFDTLFPHLAAKESTDDEINKQNLKKALDRCLNKIGQKYREPLLLYYYENMDYKEIADILQIPISTVGVRLRRGKTILQKFVKESSLI